jgi:hypothetical protein
MDNPDKLATYGRRRKTKQKHNTFKCVGRRSAQTNTKHVDKTRALRNDSNLELSLVSHYIQNKNLKSRPISQPNKCSIRHCFRKDSTNRDLNSCPLSDRILQCDILSAIMLFNAFITDSSQWSQQYVFRENAHSYQYKVISTIMFWKFCHIH